jgi:hypothetical protein
LLGESEVSERTSWSGEGGGVKEADADAVDERGTNDGDTLTMKEGGVDFLLVLG